MSATTQTTEVQRATFWQPRQPILWLYLTLLIVFGTLVLGPVVIASATPEGLAAALIIVGVQAVALWFIARAMPQLKRQPLSLRLFALAVGLFVAVGSAVFLNQIGALAVAAYGLTSFSAALTAPIGEDISRLLGVLAVLTLATRGRITVMDGAVYGFLVGMGFELFENLLYAIRSDDLIATLSTALTRTLVGFGLHALWTTVGGAALAYCLARKQRGLSGRWLVLPAAMLLPMLLHALWDLVPVFAKSAGVLAVLAVLYLVSVAAFLAAVRAGRAADWAWITQTAPGRTLTAAEWKTLPRAERTRLTREAELADAAAATNLPR